MLMHDRRGVSAAMLAWTALLLGGYSQSWAAELHVPSEFSTIQAAIDASNDGDVVTLQLGVYAGAGNTDLNYGGRLITVRSVDPTSPSVVAATVIDCEGVSRAFLFESGETQAARVEGLTIRHGAVTPIGTIRSRLQTWPTIADCVIRDCEGVAIQATQQGKLSLERCVIENNDSSTLTFNAGNLDVNYVLSGVTLRDCLIRDNVGTAINFNGDFLVVEDTRLEHNTGGAIRVSEASLFELHRCWFIENHNDGFGGGLFFNPHSAPESLEIEGCVFLDNTSAQKGGGIYMNANAISGDAAIENCTLVGNSADESGGNVGVAGRQLSIRNSILWNGSAPSGAELYLGPGLTGGGPGAFIPPATVAIDFAILPDSSAPALISGGATLLIGDGVLHGDPLFQDEAAGNVHLRLQSPARDAGDPDFNSSPDATDIDGEPRLFGGTVDLGADEINFGFIPGDLDGDGDVDEGDYDLFAECLDGPANPPAMECTSDADLDGDGHVDLRDYAELVTNAM